MIDADVLENTPTSRGSPMGDDVSSGEKTLTRADIAQFLVAHARTQGNRPSGTRYLQSLRMTFHNVTSGQKTPIG